MPFETIQGVSENKYSYSFLNVFKSSSKFNIFWDPCMKLMIHGNTPFDCSNYLELRKLGESERVLIFLLLPDVNKLKWNVYELWSIFVKIWLDQSFYFYVLSYFYSCWCRCLCGSLNIPLQRICAIIPNRNFPNLLCNLML